MTRSELLAPAAPCIECPNALVHVEAVVADHERAIGHIEFVGMAAVVKIHVAPITHHQGVDRVPKLDVISICSCLHGTAPSAGPLAGNSISRRRRWLVNLESAERPSRRQPE